MTHEEIKNQIKAIQDWNRQERRRLLKEQSNRRAEKMRPLIEACGEIGHESYPTGEHNILGEEVLRCKWCGDHMGWVE